MTRCPMSKCTRTFGLNKILIKGQIKAFGNVRVRHGGNPQKGFQLVSKVHLLDSEGEVKFTSRHKEDVLRWQLSIITMDLKHW